MYNKDNQILTHTWGDMTVPTPFNTSKLITVIVKSWLDFAACALFDQTSGSD